MRPEISVVLPVFNGMPYLREALESIRSQTLEDFEVVVLDNGSSDGSREYLEETARQDPRIFVYTEPRPLGMVGSSNAAVARSSGMLVARMDADDVAHRRRLEEQLRALRETDDAVLVGCISEGIDATGTRVRPRDRSLISKKGRVAPIAHGSIMFDRATFDAAGGYRELSEGFEDQDLYRRMGRLGKLLVLADPPYGYRFHLDNWTTTFLQDYGEMALVPFSAQRIWSGARAPWLPLPTIKKMGFRAGSQAFLYCTWGAVSPKTLRSTLAAGLRVRDAVAGWRLKRSGRTQPFVWTFD